MGESSLHRRYRIIEKGTEFKWKPNALRHSFASYWHFDNAVVCLSLKI
jgi:hypothetical protein